MVTDREYDYIVVGGGSAGCVLARRLSDDPAVQVLLVERGAAYSRMMLGIPLIGKRNGGRYLETHWTRPQPGCAARQLPLPVARALGGGSSVNAMIYVRGERKAYDRWADQGAVGWDHAGVLPYFRKLEDFEGGASEHHGSGGPVGISESRYRSRFGQSFVQACVTSGVPRNHDFTGARQEGAGFLQFTMSGGERSSTALGYLRPVRSRSNLHVLAETEIHRILFENGNARGVRGRNARGELTVRAGREVVLAAGAIGSPRLLLLSGVGPADELRALGIEPVCDSPGVGKGLQDHPRFSIVFQPRDPVPHSLPALAPALLRWFVRRDGVFASSLTDACAFLRLDDRSELLDCQLVVQFMGDATARQAVHVHPCLIDVESRGSVTLASSDPGAAAIVDPSYLSTQREMDVAVAALQYVRALAETRPLREFGLVRELQPGADVRTDREIRDYVARSIGTAFHPAGTCRMGSDEAAVVDPGLRVRGLGGLRVADASVMPSLINGNTNGPTIMIAEKAADLIAG